MNDSPVASTTVASAAPVDAFLDRVLATVRRYGRTIGLLLAGVAAAYLLALAILLIVTPPRRVSRLPFRLTFEGAKTGTYPNGVAFSPSEIVAIPILMDVFRSNNLDDYTTFDEFSRSFHITETNRDLERLEVNYASKLTDLRLNAIERQQLEREFDARRAAIQNSDFELNFTRHAALRKIPKSLADKVLRDILRSWASFAVQTKRVLDVRVTLLSGNVAQSTLSEDPAVALLMLRRRADVMLQNLDELSRYPGVSFVNTPRDKKTLAEIRLDLQDVIRFDLDPQVLALPAQGAVRDRAGLLRVAEAQLAYDQRLLEVAKAREDASRKALEAYDQSRGSRPAPTGDSSATSADREMVTPELTSSFLDRMIELTNSDRERFRQRLAQELLTASLDRPAREAVVNYDEDVLRALREAPVVADAAAASRLMQHSKNTSAKLQAVAANVSTIYELASRQLHPETELFVPTGPVRNWILFGVDPLTTVIYGIALLLLSLPLILAGCMLHERHHSQRVRSAAGAQPAAPLPQA